MDTLIYIVTLDHHKENLHEDFYFIQVGNKVVETARFYRSVPGTVENYSIPNHTLLAQFSTSLLLLWERMRVAFAGS